ncbi:thioredoxin family protein [Microbulbifer sp. JSM ZJ756]|uniref:thioredoxin family protein n=1 Tax=Microbulbifer sp. JSM ZJ756 TaxID=3376191 RepID=UPI003797369B
MKSFMFGLALLFACLEAVADESSGRVYQPVTDTMAQVDRALARANEEGKTALIVMGANWCHDSRALATHLQEPSIAPELEQEFVIQYVDVGYLERNFDVNRRFGLPVIFGTPSALLVDPATGKLLNRDSVHIWGNAASFSAGETRDRLRRQATAPDNSIETGGHLAALLEDIDSFEQRQAGRIYAGFKVVGPMLAAYKEGEEASEFEHYWKQLYEMRTRLPRDLQRLRREARQRVADGETDIQLDFPVYAAFDWE